MSIDLKNRQRKRTKILQAPGWRVGLPGGSNAGTVLFLIVAFLAISAAIAIVFPFTAVPPLTFDPHDIRYLEVELLYELSLEEAIDWSGDAALVYVDHDLFPEGSEDKLNAVYMYRSGTRSGSFFVYFDVSEDQLRSATTTKEELFPYGPEETALAPIQMKDVVKDIGWIYYVMEQNGAYGYVEENKYDMNWPISLRLGPLDRVEGGSPIVWYAYFSSDNPGSFQISLDAVDLTVVDRTEH